MKQKTILPLAFFILVSQSAGLIGSLFTAPSIDSWYQFLEKPALQPPGWVFGPVWFLLYTLMGIAAFLIWKKGWKKKAVRSALLVFAFQLILNALWSVLFFGLHSPLLALIGIVLLWCAIVWTMYLFYKLSKPASYLFIPYILWVSFAMYLNYAIHILN